MTRLVGFGGRRREDVGVLPHAAYRTYSRAMSKECACLRQSTPLDYGPSRRNDRGQHDDRMAWKVHLKREQGWMDLCSRRHRNGFVLCRDFHTRCGAVADALKQRFPIPGPIPFAGAPTLERVHRTKLFQAAAYSRAAEIRPHLCLLMWRHRPKIDHLSIDLFPPLGFPIAHCEGVADYACPRL